LLLLLFIVYVRYLMMEDGRSQNWLLNRSSDTTIIYYIHLHLFIISSFIKHYCLC
jgi:hypothetical protein